MGMGQGGSLTADGSPENSGHTNSLSSHQHLVLLEFVLWRKRFNQNALGLERKLVKK